MSNFKQEEFLYETKNIIDNRYDVSVRLSYGRMWKQQKRRCSGIPFSGSYREPGTFRFSGGRF
jgi:hypothetical protein